MRFCWQPQFPHPLEKERVSFHLGLSSADLSKSFLSGKWFAESLVFAFGHRQRQRVCLGIRLPLRPTPVPPGGPRTLFTVPSHLLLNPAWRLRVLPGEPYALLSLMTTLVHPSRLSSCVTSFMKPFRISSPADTFPNRRSQSSEFSEPLCSSGPKLSAYPMTSYGGCPCPISLNGGGGRRKKEVGTVTIVMVVLVIDPSQGPAWCSAFLCLLFNFHYHPIWWVP